MNKGPNATAGGDKQVKAIPEKLVPLVSKVMKYYSRANVWVFKKSNGRLWKNFPGGFPICLVEMKGAKTGAKRETPLIYLPVSEGSDSVYLVASQGGMPKNPVWYYNVSAHPDITVTVGGKSTPLRARRLSAEEKQAAWPRLCELYPDFDEYQARTERDIPVFICEPR
ncbi:nitroreductase family deazaflavin-dependent oxidoreductase [Spongiibacter sp.]|uniref:nitroreductase family deazaflavin-dependent oxidoreductase n=1 Tax=Spongiibacter sp. TaxID=2024860 RepID=UPI00356A6E77